VGAHFPFQRNEGFITLRRYFDYTPLIQLVQPEPEPIRSEARPVVQLSQGNFTGLPGQDIEETDLIGG
jgi:hypothetical protein